jgi:excisionase family DNA binding protein
MRASTAALEPLLTVADVAAICQVSRATVYAWVAAGQLKPVDLPARKTRFRRRDVAAFLGEEVSE